MARPPSARVKATVHLPEALWHQLRLRALEERTSATKLVIKAIEAWLKTNPPKPRKGGA